MGRSVVKWDREPVDRKQVIVSGAILLTEPLYVSGVPFTDIRFDPQLLGVPGRSAELLYCRSIIQATIPAAWIREEAPNWPRYIDPYNISDDKCEMVIAVSDLEIPEASYLTAGIRDPEDLGIGADCDGVAGELATIAKLLITADGDPVIALDLYRLAR